MFTFKKEGAGHMACPCYYSLFYQTIANIFTAGDPYQIKLQFFRTSLNKTI